MEATSKKMEVDSAEVCSPSFPQKAKLKSILDPKKILKRKPRKHLSTEDENKRIATYRKSLLRREEIQDLVDYTSPSLVFHQMNLNPFGRNHAVAEHFSLVSVEGKPIKNVVVCKICKRVQIRFQNGTTNLKSHLQHHKLQLPQSAEKTEKKGANKKRMKERAEQSGHDESLVLAE